MIRACERLGHEVHFVFLPSRQMGDFDFEEHVRAFAAERFHVLERKKFPELRYYVSRIFHKIKRKIKNSPFRISDLDETYFRGFTSQISILNSVFGFDVVITQYVTFSLVFDAFGPSTLKIIDTHDRFQNEMPSAEERRGLLRADKVLAIQSSEAQYFADLIPERKDSIDVVSHIIDLAEPVNVRTCSGATFIGSDFHQNNVSILWFISEVLPLVIKEDPAFRFYVAGTVCRKIPDAPCVVKLGVVAAFEDAFANGPILVNCITAGTGVKIKLLEAFGHGIPVVSTQMGVEGIADEDLTGVSICPDGSARIFADSLLALYRNADARATKGSLAFETAKLWNKRQISSLKDCLGTIR